MRRLHVQTVMVFLAIVLLAISCATISNIQGSRFSLTPKASTEVQTGLLMGTVNYGVGFYFPTTTDILDISLLKTDSTTGLVTEVSHQRIRNIQNFPVQFSVRYDSSSISESDSCTMIVSLYIDDAIKAQGITLLHRDGEGYADPVLTLLPI